MVFSLPRRHFPDEFNAEIAALKRTFPRGDQAAQERACAARVALQAIARAKEAGEPDERYARHEHAAEPFQGLLNSISGRV